MRKSRTKQELNNGRDKERQTIKGRQDGSKTEEEERKM